MREVEHQNKRSGKKRKVKSQDRLNSLAIMKSDTTKLDYSDVIHEFANAKSRKRYFQK